MGGGADEVVDGTGGFGPVDGAKRGLGGERRGGGEIEGTGGDGEGGEMGEELAGHLAACGDQATIERGGGVVNGDGPGTLEDEVADVAGGLHVAEGETGFLGAGEDGPGDGGMTGSVGDEGGEALDEAETGDLEQPLGEGEMEAHDEDEVGTQPLEALDVFVDVDAIAGKAGDVSGHGELGEVAIVGDGGSGLGSQGEDGGEVGMKLKELLEDVPGELGSADKDDAHSRHSKVTTRNSKVEGPYLLSDSIGKKGGWSCVENQEEVEAGGGGGLRRRVKRGIRLRGRGKWTPSGRRGGGSRIR